MSEKEKELIELIRNSDNPQMALYKAIGIILEVTQSTAPAYLKG